MISSIFSKTKPINFVLLLGLFAFYYGFWFYLDPQKEVSGAEIGWFFAKLLGVYMELFLLNFMIRKNHITANNAYAALFFVILMGVFPNTMFHWEVFVAHVLILFALRRILSIRSLVAMKLKIFDASLWILIASFFNDWLLLFLFILGLAIYFYQASHYRNWLIIGVAISAYLLLIFAWIGGPQIAQFLSKHYVFTTSFNLDFVSFSQGKALVLFVVLTLIAAALNYKNLSKSVLGRLLSIRLVLFSFLVGVAVALLQFSTEPANILFAFFPAAILMSNALEEIKRKWIKNALLWIGLVLPVLIASLKAFQ